MKYQQEVTYVDAEGVLQSEVFNNTTGQVAMIECRLKYPECTVIGAGRVFDKKPDL